jgi:hypothetical protein
VLKLEVIKNDIDSVFALNFELIGYLKLFSLLPQIKAESILKLDWLFSWHKIAT